ncbi:MAG: hypothetical protein WCI05_05005 [Myxococcales bacterium]
MALPCALALAACGGSGSSSVFTDNKDGGGSVDASIPLVDGAGAGDGTVRRPDGSIFGDASSDAYIPPNCAAKTCADFFDGGANCGRISDGCGAMLSCGDCPTGQTCGGAGLPFECGTTCTPKTCVQQGLACGSTGDGCGATLSCGTCINGESCGGGGVSGACGKPPCPPRTCLDQSIQCGPANDGCGNLVQCGTCEAGTCGGGGTPYVCGSPVLVDANPCVPTTCSALGLNCGPAGDGCGNAIDCGNCTPPQTCGGGAQPGSCGGTTGCIPKTCLALGLSCGSVGDGCGTLLDCGHCTAPDSCGGQEYGKCGHSCVPSTCTQQGLSCGQTSDGCGNVLNCGTCTDPDTCGGGGLAGKCGSTCTNFCRKQVKCDGGATTTVKGTVYSPAKGKWTSCPTCGDPLYGAVVYVPNETVAAFPTGVSCDQCGAQASGAPLVTAISAADGTFTLTNVPAGVDFPLVIQLGRWRRQITVPAITACTEKVLLPEQTRLPRNKTEGNIPLTAMVTGSVDALECVLRKIGIDDSEFTNPVTGGRIQFYLPPSGPGAKISSATPSYNDLMGVPATLAKYDMAIFACQGGEYSKNTTHQKNLVDYANKGGRVFATHYSYTWLYNVSPFNTVATWNKNQSSPQDPFLGTIDTTIVGGRGQAFSDWLRNLGALTTAGKVSLNITRHDVDAVVAPTQGWIYGINTSPNPDKNTVQHLTFNTPVGSAAAQQCGRVLFSDFHVNNSSGSATFPGSCGSTLTMTAQEKVLEFMLFDLASCVTPDTPLVCQPKTCGQLGFTCGSIGDGCGNLLQCGPCSTPQTCGGGGTPGVCGGCIPKTCQTQGLACGFTGDGCNNILNCGTCVDPQTCGGAGTPGVCGASTCTKATCTSLGFVCGPAGDGCGGALACGTCPTGQYCGAGGAPGKCASLDSGACLPTNCTALGFNCGPAGDGCGGALSCGTCTIAGQTCGGGGAPGKCGSACTPKTCLQLGLFCGAAGDGCGGTLSCGTCTIAGQTCGGGGVTGVCGITSCTPRLCPAQNLNCGNTTDGCGHPLNCGTCVDPEVCGGAGTPGVCGVIPTPK